MEQELKSNQRDSILVVSDEVLVRNFLIAALRAAGYSVIAAADPAEARTLMKAMPDCVRLLLICLDGERGMAAAEALKQDCASFRAIIVSPEARRRLAENEAPAELMNAVERAFYDTGSGRDK